MKTNEKHLQFTKTPSFRWSKACGKRLKELTISRVPHLTNEELAKELFYNAPQQISGLFKGNYKTIDSDRLKKLEELFGVWSRYLLCESDYKTQEEMLQAAHQSDLLQYKSTLAYFESLGLKVEPNLYFCCSNSNIGDIVEMYSDCFADGEMDWITKKFTWKYDDDCEIYRTYNLEDGGIADDVLCKYIKLKRNPNEDNDLKELSELTKKDSFNPITGENYEKYDDIDNLYDEFTFGVRIMYEISYQGKRLGTINVNSMKMFFDHVDAICKASIETIFCSEYYDYIDEENNVI